jgi:hypothetical protein
MTTSTQVRSQCLQRIAIEQLRQQLAADADGSDALDALRPL